jgi:hypothetical protein
VLEVPAFPVVDFFLCHCCRSAEADFVATYHTIGADIAGYGGPDWRNSRGCGEPDNNYGPFCDRKKEMGSPVVPGSAT